MEMDIDRYNREAWDREVQDGNAWTLPVSSEQIARARLGDFDLSLLPQKALPEAWLGDVRGRHILCLAGSGGQQGPLLAAAGARVVVLDNAPMQLMQDKAVAGEHGLDVKTHLGSMKDLTAFGAETFDLIIHPLSNMYVDAVQCVWNGCYRVLKRGGTLLSAFWNPINYLFDYDKWEADGTREVAYAIPHSPLRAWSAQRLAAFLQTKEPLEFGHSLSEQIGGQLDAGFVLTGFLEDRFPQDDILSGYMDTIILTRAQKQ